MANYQHTSDIISDVLFRASEVTDGSSDFKAKALEYLNRAQRALFLGGTELVPEINEVFWWTKGEASLILQPSITSGSVSVTKNSASITLSQAPKDVDSSNISVAGYFLRITGHSDVFKVDSTHTSGTTSATLDTVYTGTTASAADFTLMKLEYNLATDCLKVVAPMVNYKESETWIYESSLSEMDHAYPLRLVAAGTPSRFAHVDEDTVRFNTYGSRNDELIKIDYDYIKKPADMAATGSVEPQVPLHYRHVLADMTLFYLLPDKEDNKAASIGAMAQSGIRAMSKENRARFAQAGEIGAIRPRLRGTRFVGPLRTETGTIIG